MNEDRETRLAPPLGDIEPHAGLLKRPPDDQLLYKVMRTEHFIAALEGCYLHFNRVDSYKDFSGADLHDGRQLPMDEPGNRSSTFIKASDFSVADYYDRCRGRTYACCFSTVNSDFIWKNYGAGGKRGKVGLVFRFDRLRTMLNAVMDPSRLAVLCSGLRCHQIFSINYGVVEYVDWQSYQANQRHLPNPVVYAHLKDKAFLEEKELRITLSAIGMGHFALNDGQLLAFPDHLQLGFDFGAAIASGAIDQIEHSPDCDSEAFCRVLERFGIGRKNASP